MAEYDPMTAERTTEAAPAAKPSPEMGMGALETVAEAQEEGQGHPDEAPKAGGKSSATTDTKAAETEASASEKEQERGYLRQADYTRKTQDLARDRDSLRAEREQLQKERAEWIATQTLARQQPQPENGGLTSHQIQQLTNDPSLTPADRQGLSFVAKMAADNEKLQQTVAQLAQQLEKLAPQFEQTTQAVSQLSSQQQDTRTRELLLQGREAIELFGRETVEQHRDALGRLLGMVHPDSGEPYTVAEIIGMVSGRSIEEAKAAKAGNRQARNSAKAQASPRGSNAGNIDAGGFLTREQAIAQIKQTV